MDNNLSIRLFLIVLEVIGTTALKRVEARPMAVTIYMCKSDFYCLNIINRPPGTYCGCRAGLCKCWKLHQAAQDVSTEYPNLNNSVHLRN
ncbi:hypothetical protein SAY87_003590 [Trapa incisa]|uniref:Uncharacterized protein n=1 Tax=Trapa incisa TaxID=236973 RepID=A0AAN7KP32_9MYRT|nr:hypothetical protein SAY87_003590 [Trapa incisa]